MVNSDFIHNKQPYLDKIVVYDYEDYKTNKKCIINYMM